MTKETVKRQATSIFFSANPNPLQNWDKEVKNGHIRRILDEDVKSLVLEISGTNVATTYITCPIKPRASLGVRLPFLILIVKNMKKYFTFEIQILDDKNMRRRFRVSNFQSTTKVRPFCTTMPIGLSSGWNQIQFNLADFTRRAYGSTYMETMRLQIHANVRIRRIYFADRLYTEDEMPNEFKMYLPPGAKKPIKEKAGGKGKKAETKDEKPAEAKATEELELLDIKLDGEPSAAPPTPVGEGEGPEVSPADTEAVSEPPAEPAQAVQEEGGKPEGEVQEGGETAPVESPTEDVGEIGPTDAPAASEVTEGTTADVSELPSENVPPPPAEAPETTEPPAATEPPAGTEPSATTEPPSEPPAPETNE